MWMMVGAGGGGWGDVLERDPQMVIEDLRSGAISEHSVQEIYRVVYDREGLIVDVEATEALRAQARVERKAAGKPYSEFIKEWEQRRPPEHALKYFGEFPGTVA